MKNEELKNTNEVTPKVEETNFDAEQLLESEISEVEGGATECTGCSWACYSGGML
ncbi:MAG: hypothetical protein LUF85_02220 [Bacteroides sp.]|nr:hypothetical protein [Bacteroides sp.]